ncbi:hypothetical protein C7Y44_04795 [Paenibacillus popilliae]|uniref:Uncharacterized protein n=1 Tax=Paenibacillus popilliae TaxID=78057 RepID=A0ABY3AX30_PAEPP|nr:hypothetical protein C7Y44_04795 [Paenibacillus sp. SDF0028]
MIIFVHHRPHCLPPFVPNDRQRTTIRCAQCDVFVWRP